MTGLEDCIRTLNSYDWFALSGATIDHARMEDGATHALLYVQSLDAKGIRFQVPARRDRAWEDAVGLDPASTAWMSEAKRHAAIHRATLDGSFLARLAWLVAPSERRNWLGELRTARWEVRDDRRELRRATRSHLRGLLPAAATSWRYGRGRGRRELG